MTALKINFANFNENEFGISSRESTLMKDLLTFYNSDTNHIQTILSIIIRTSKNKNKINYDNNESNRQVSDFIKDVPHISLRTLDWFVTNYAKKNDTIYKLDSTQGDHFWVYRSYKAQLDSFSKKLFDPFCRGSRITLVDPFGNRYKTTVSQVNFVRWIIDNKIIRYVQCNYKTITDDMNQNQNLRYKGRGKKGKAQKRMMRKELSISATKTVTKHDIKITVNFN